MAPGPNDWQRVRELFERALALTGSERAAFLETGCRGDSALRDEVLRMVDSHERATGFLSSPAAALLDSDASKSFEGQQVGPYLLGARIGAGGMGEVYKARDTRLDRAVAVKMLPPDIADDPVARERFVREGRAIAALNHPNICALYDVADTAGLAPGSPFYLVMEYLEGQTLADRLARGALPMPYALQIGTQIASALDKAHRAGIVHRDLKPGNVFLVRGGGSTAPTVKLLDFGLAKAAASRGAESVATRSATAANLTAPGTIIGTIQYMAPEQVEGKDVDSRTDIFALGTVLHEMLTGAKAFAGNSQASLTAAILEHDPPPVSALLRSAPPALDRVVGKCLAKDPDDRWQTAADLASELQWIAQSGSAGAARQATGSRMSRALPLLGWLTAATIAAVLVITFVVNRPAGSAPPMTVKRFDVTMPYLEPPIATLVLTPDGSAFIYAAGGGNRSDARFMLHTLGDGLSHALQGTVGATHAFFSPDGKWVGFFQNNRLRKMSIAGGPAVDICEMARFGEASWGDDDRIVFSRPDGLWRVAAAGGTSERLTSLAPGEASHDSPQILPGGDAVVFSIDNTSGKRDDSAVVVLSIPNGERRVLVKGGNTGRVAPTGHLLYRRGWDLLAVRFDRSRLATSGDPVLVASDTQNFTISAEGTLVYLPQTRDDSERTLVWSDKGGGLRPLPAPPRPYAHPVLLPDGQGLIVEVEAAPHNLWRYDSRSGAMTLLTPEGANHRAVLSPDGRFMVFSSDRVSPRSLFRQATDGGGAAERVIEAPSMHNVSSWSRDGRWILYSEIHPKTQDDVWYVSMVGDRTSHVFVNTPAAEHSAVFSPDGRWVAYVSDESGRNEVFIAPFPGPGARRQVSTDGGEVPLFSNDGRTLYYKLGERIMGADVAGEPVLTVGAPRVEFEIPGAQRFTVMPFPVNANGTSVLYVRQQAEGSPPHTVRVVVNWFEELRRITGAR